MKTPAAREDVSPLDEVVALLDKVVALLDKVVALLDKVVALLDADDALARTSIFTEISSYNIRCRESDRIRLISIRRRR
jgi:hypothetical protein